jgi:hypothetical protein|tara:strand:+ start:4288 stop:4662 length:375 start_codon:yes stop_codon:yes gene_type:complete
MIWNMLPTLFKAGSEIYKNRQRAKIALSQAELLNAEKAARGEIEIEKIKIQERQNDYKDEIVLVLISIPLMIAAWGVFSDDPQIIAKLEAFFDQINKFPLWLQGLIIGGYSTVLGIKGINTFKK